MRIFRIIPFSWLPSSWGLSGDLRREQEARYYYDGMELDIMLAEIRYEGASLDHAKLEISKKYSVISEEEYEEKKAKLISDPIEREVALVMAAVNAKEITEIEGEKRIATLRKEPWVRVVKDGFLDEDMGPDSYFFEFDWNDIWIQTLKDAGYSGTTDESIIQVWFQDVCNSPTADIPINNGLIVS